MNSSVEHFIGCDGPFSAAKVVLFGAPYDSTTSYRPGARFGSAAIRRESFGIETFSPYQDRDLDGAPVFDAGDLELPFGAPEPALAMVEERAAEILDAGKLPFLLGGEHLVTLGAVRAVAKRCRNAAILHFDAHADLREEYLGNPLSHATALHRCLDAFGEGTAAPRLWQFGIRSGTGEEFAFGRSAGVVTERFSLETVPAVCAELAAAKRPVYVTVDLDVLDPSEFPGTGTPEAGGVTFDALRRALAAALALDVVGMDFVELAPALDPTGRSTALACKLLREALLGLV